MMAAAGKKMMRVTLMGSLHGRVKGHRECVRGLGLRRRHHSVEVEDTPCTPRDGQQGLLPGEVEEV